MSAQGPSPAVTFYPITVETGSKDRQGHYVLLNGSLVALLVRLDDECHGLRRGKLYLEVAFGDYATPTATYFDDFEQARTWCEERYRAISPRNIGRPLPHFG